MSNKAAWVPVERLANCNRCGDEQVAWVKSVRTGKWYLATAYVDGRSFRANRLDPHYKHCPACICATCEPSGIDPQVKA
jgi:hypothetical protein